MGARTERSLGTLHRSAAVGLWLLPIYGLLLALSTVTHQPDIDDFKAYADYVTTELFLVSHLVASVGGSALAILGVFAALTFLARGRAARAAVVGVVLTVIADVYLAAAFGSASFVQPGIGRAYLNGVQGMEDLNKDTAYGTALNITAAFAVLVFIAAAIVLGVAIVRTDRRLRLPGIGYAVFLPVFAVSGFLFELVQPFAGLLAAAATVVLALRLPRAVTEPTEP